MTWVKLDDQFHAHPKAARAFATCDASLGLHMLAMSYAGCFGTEGHIDVVFVKTKVPSAAKRAKSVSALVESGLWDVTENGWKIHDWEIYNGDAESREAARKAKVEAGRKGGLAKAANAAAASKTPSSELAGAKQALGGVLVAPSPSPVLTTTAMSGENAEPVAPHSIDEARDRLQSAQVQQVFDAWLRARAEQSGTRPTAKLDDKRRKLIRRALASHGLDDVLAAVVGWRNSPHHRGENPSSTVYDGLHLLLRDAEHIERFRDLAAQPAGRPVNGRSVSDTELTRLLIEGR